MCSGRRPDGCTAWRCPAGSERPDPPKESDAAPSEHADAGPQVAERALAVPAGHRRRRTRPAVVARSVGAGPPDAGAGQLQRRPAGCGGARPHRGRLVPDEVQVADHEGGYTPFEADVTGYVVPGQEVRVTVVVNNVLTWQSIPPGVVEQATSGPRQTYWHDFFNYAGIHRSVWLYSTPVDHVSDVTVVTGREGSTGTVRYQVEASGGSGLDVQRVE